jgi:hypothetical protein
MKRFAFFLILTGWLVPLASAQETEHVQVGVFADYLRLAQTDTNFAGLGARVGVIAFHSLKLEGEMSYDFDQAFTESFRDSTTGSITVRRTGMRTLHGEFGPKVNLGETGTYTRLSLSKAASSISASTTRRPPSEPFSAASTISVVKMSTPCYIRVAVSRAT